MKKLFITALSSILAFGAFADEMPVPPMDNGHSGGHKIGMMANLTDEQKACIEAFGCKLPEHPTMGEKSDFGGKPEKPDFDKMPENNKRPEMTEEQKEAMDCMRKAMESCGVEMPKRPEMPNGDRPPRPENMPQE